MTRIRVLAVDGSAVMPRLLSTTLGGATDVEVVASVTSEGMALRRLEECVIDLVTVDVVALGNDGLATVAEIRRRHRELPIIMFSARPPPGSSLAACALISGASVFVARPDQPGAFERCVRETLLPAIRGLVTRSWLAPELPRPGAGAPPWVAAPGGASVRARPRLQRPDAIAIAASTGGPAALTALFACLRAPLRVPILITQHIPADFVPMLVTRLQKVSALPVQVAVDGAIAEPGTAYLAPGAVHLRARRRGRLLVLELGHDAPVHSCRPAADPMITSLVETCGGGVLAIILTGMGKDGVVGAGQVRHAGGEVIAQDQASSVVWGMPRAVILAGHASEVLPLDQIGEAINRRSGGLAHLPPG